MKKSKRVGNNVAFFVLLTLSVLFLVPIIIFYIFCQKYIIKGVVAGAVKG